MLSCHGCAGARSAAPARPSGRAMPSVAARPTSRGRRAVLAGKCLLAVNGSGRRPNVLPMLTLSEAAVDETAG
eukprot:3241441-Lingulodinium_polyedra.AAC.1